MAKSGKFIVAFGINGPKRAFLAKNGQIFTKIGQKKTRIFLWKFFSAFFKTPKNRFLWQKSGKFIVAFGRNGPKRSFLAKNGQTLSKKTRIFPQKFFSPFFKRPKNRFLWQNQENL